MFFYARDERAKVPEWRFSREKALTAGMRAVRAGLEIISAVAKLYPNSVKLEARVGIATGLVVVGDLIGEDSAQEQLVVGETPNLAARSDLRPIGFQNDQLP